jgi:DNA adenine methylase
MESTLKNGLTPVTPTKPVAAYQGGKRNLSKRLCGLIAQTPHTLYAEPFVGMGGVFLRRAERPRAEVINDISKDVTTVFRILQRHYVAFIDMLRYQITSRAEFERLVKVDPETLTDLERAARFIYLQRLAFGGKVVGRNFGTATERPARFDITRLVPLLEDIHERLAGVVIECLPYGDFITRYDREGTLFYLDPPYWSGETDYGKGVFSRDDFQRLADQLRGIKGKFIFSINDVPEIREMFDWANLQGAEHRFTLSGGSGVPAKELIIMGHQLAPV